MGKPKKSERATAGVGGFTSPRPSRPLPERALRLVPESILSLETTAPKRPTITIDGLKYRLSFYEDFSLWQIQKLYELMEAVGEFEELAVSDEGQEITTEQWAKLDRAEWEQYGLIVEMVLPDLPEPTLLALNTNQRRAVVQAFYAATGATAGTPGETQAAPTGPEAAAPPTGSPS